MGGAGPPPPGGAGRVRRDSEDGLRTIIARATSGDAAWFLAAVHQIADILARRGDQDPAGMRRAKAIGILARPAEALQLILDDRARHNPADSATPTPDAEPESESGDEWEPDLEGDGHVSQPGAAPAGFDAKAARPKIVLHFHLTEDVLKYGNGVVRPDHGDPLLVSELVEFLTGTGCPIRVQPVVDPASTAPIDGYEVSGRLRAAVRHRQVADVFPFGTCIAESMDLDHTERYVPMDDGGPSGQTRLDNLGPLARPGHRAATHGSWQKAQPAPGYYLHRSPHGHVWAVTNQGTLALGRTSFSDAVWRAAQPALTQGAA